VPGSRNPIGPTAGSVIKDGEYCADVPLGSIALTTKAEKQTTVHLFIYGEDKKEVSKDTSPRPKCEVKFTPKSDRKFLLSVRNLGLGANTVTLEVKTAKDKEEKQN
jgi:hypothetical protein